MSQVQLRHFCNSREWELGIGNGNGMGIAHGWTGEWEWEWTNGNGREWEQKCHSRSPLVSTRHHIIITVFQFFYARVIFVQY